MSRVSYVLILPLPKPAKPQPSHRSQGDPSLPDAQAQHLDHPDPLPLPTSVTQLAPCLSPHVPRLASARSLPAAGRAPSLAPPVTRQHCSQTNLHAGVGSGPCLLGTRPRLPFQGRGGLRITKLHSVCCPHVTRLQPSKVGGVLILEAVSSLGSHGLLFALLPCWLPIVRLLGFFHLIIST